MSAPKHESAGNEVTADGIVHRCSCGWVSPPCFSNAAASCLGIDHRAQAKPTNGEGSVMNTTPPMTDAEFLAYIERTTGLKVLILTMLPLGMPLVDRYGKMLWRVRSIAYEFYAHEQRVREEQHRVTVKRCADVCEQRADSLRDGSAIARQCAKDVLSQMDVLAKQGGK